MTIRVREAEPRDFEAVSALLEELGRPKVLGTAQESDHRGRYLQWIQAPNGFGFVAEDDQQVIGFIDLDLIPRLNFLAPLAWVHDLVVTEGARSGGAGAALLGRAEEVARTQGSFALGLVSANWRTRAHAFYERQGMEDAAKEFVKVLGDFPWPPPVPGDPGPQPTDSST